MKKISEADKTELKRLNDAVKDALSNRKAWLDEKTKEYAKFKIGEPIYDICTGRKLGVVTEYYRYHSNNHEGVYDTSLSIHYNFVEDEFSRVRCIGNTSGLSYDIKVGTKEDHKNYLIRKLKGLTK